MISNAVFGIAIERKVEQGVEVSLSKIVRGSTSLKHRRKSIHEKINRP